MPSRMFEPPYTGIATVQYFAYRILPNGNAHGASETEVRGIMEEALELYKREHPWRATQIGLYLQTPAERFGGGSSVLRVIPDVSGRPR